MLRFSRFEQRISSVRVHSGRDLWHPKCHQIPGKRVILDTSHQIQARTSGAQPRAKGRLSLACGLRGAGTGITDLYQAGSLKALFPRPRDTMLDAVVLNTAGGITGGDSFSLDLEVGDTAALCVTSQAAERVYGAQPGETGTVAMSARVGASARLHWLPQETIVFDRSRLRRKLDIDVAATSELLCVESMVFGREAMGEAVRDTGLHDLWHIRRDGKLVFADATRLVGDAQRILASGATAGGSLATAAVLFVSGTAEGRLSGLRDRVLPHGGASLIRDGVLFARLVAPDSFRLRQTLLPVISYLSDRPLPKTWNL